jgi:hypothetical protein
MYLILLTHFVVVLDQCFFWGESTLQGCNHNPMSQKRCQIVKKNSQNRINIYVLSFKAMVIMASYCFFHFYECQRIQTKNPFDEILN